MSYMRALEHKQSDRKATEKGRKHADIRTIISGKFYNPATVNIYEDCLVGYEGETIESEAVVADLLRRGTSQGQGQQGQQGQGQRGEEEGKSRLRAARCARRGRGGER